MKTKYLKQTIISIITASVLVTSSVSFASRDSREEERFADRKARDIMAQVETQIKNEQTLSNPKFKSKIDVLYDLYNTLSGRNKRAKAKAIENLYGDGGRYDREGGSNQGQDRNNAEHNYGAPGDGIY